MGGGPITVNVLDVELPPPGAGFTTKTPTWPGVARSPAWIAAVTCVALTKVVARCCPPKLTIEPETKFVPVTVSVNAPLFTMADAGEIEEIVGSGLTGPVEMAEKTDTVFCCSFAVANPGRPTEPCSPVYSKSPVATAAGTPPVAKSRWLWNVPSPFPNRTFTDPFAGHGERCKGSPKQRGRGCHRRCNPRSSNR